MAWTLANNGDSVETALGKDVCKHLCNYERFWALHVAPLTYRVMNERCIFVRAKVRPALETMATAHYAVFIHLAACHQQLKAKVNPDLFAVEGVYAFYSRIYSVEEAVVKGFLPAVGELVEKYSKSHITDDLNSKGELKRGSWRFQSRLDTNGRSGLHHDLNAAFSNATKYRHTGVHWWGIPARSGKVPGTGFIDAWIRRGHTGLGELARTDGKRFCTEFVDALTQAKHDLESIEKVLNEVWDMAIKELANFKSEFKKKDYEKAQAPTKYEKLPPWWKDPLSSETFQASGATALAMSYDPKKPEAEND